MNKNVKLLILITGALIGVLSIFYLIGKKSRSKDPVKVYIDFSRCNLHSEHVYAAFGSTDYSVTGKEADFCKLVYSIEIEMGQGPYIYCNVPQKFGKLYIRNTAMGLDFSAIKEFCGNKDKSQK